MNIYLQILITLIQVLFITRFHLEFSQVNGYIEPVNTLRKMTNPLVMPIKRLIPFLWAKKCASITVAYLITFLAIFFFVPNISLGLALVFSLILLLSTWVSFLQYGMFLYVIGSWVQIPALQKINYFLHNLFSPMLRPIQQILPSFGGLDFSPIAFLFLLSFVNSTLSGLIQRYLLS